MKVQTGEPTKITKEAPKKLSPDEIKAKIKSKFGKDLTKKKAKPIADKAEISKKSAKSSGEKEFADVGSNDPNSDLTQNKLKDILKTGAFQFNEGERKALAQILK